MNSCGLDKQCKDCKYYDYHEYQNYVCKRHAPYMVGGLNGAKVMTSYPEVSMFDWCGDFEKK